MKKIVLGLGLIAISSLGFSQKGLDSIIVEKYYVATAADSIASDISTEGLLRVGSVTYRVYADLAAGYEFQAMYGELIPGDVNNTPLHTLSITTSTSFFNNQDRGSKSPNSIPKTSLNDNSVALDSYFSVGAAGSGLFGVLKSEDNGAQNFIHPHSDGVGVLSNTVGVSIPLTAQDGIITYTTIVGGNTTTVTPQAVTFVGLNGEESVFDAISEAGSSFQVSNASIASLDGSVGPTATNRVLIGQFTTNGTFHFELNIQVGLVSGGDVQKWVSSNPEPGEFTHASLTYTSPLSGGGNNNTSPTVSLTSPAANASFTQGSTITLNAVASDVDGVVDYVTFYVDGVSISTDNASPYTATLVAAVGTHTIVAKATDDDGAESSSTPVIITVNNGGAVGINAVNALVLAMNIYPLPANDVVTLEINLPSSGFVAYTIYDPMGRAIINKQLGNISGLYSETLDISTLTSGMYFIKTYVDGTVLTKKLIKK